MPLCRKNMHAYICNASQLHWNWIVYMHVPAHLSHSRIPYQSISCWNLKKKKAIEMWTTSIPNISVQTGHDHIIFWVTTSSYRIINTFKRNNGSGCDQRSKPMINTWKYYIGLFHLTKPICRSNLHFLNIRKEKNKMKRKGGDGHNCSHHQNFA